MSEPRHIPVLRALNEFLASTDEDEAIQFTLTREGGKLVLSTFLGTEGSLPIEDEPPTGEIEVGETLKMMGRRITRELRGATGILATLDDANFVE